MCIQLLYFLTLIKLNLKFIKYIRSVKYIKYVKYVKYRMVVNSIF